MNDKDQLSGDGLSSVKGKPDLERYKTNDMFFAAVTRTQTPVVITDPNQADNPIVFANEAFVEMTGYSEAELVGNNCRMIQGPQTSPEIIKLIGQYVRERRELKTEILNYRKDGTPFWNSLTITPVFDDNNEIAYFFSSQHDITHQLIAEEQLKQSRKMEAMGQLTGGIAHDFNNLLTVIQGFAELLEIQLKSDKFNPDRAVRSVESILTAANRGASLTAQLLSFSRKQNLTASVVCLSEVIDKFLPIIQQSIGEGIEVAVSHQPGQCKVRIDSSQAEIAILNIALNARDAMSSRGLLTISTSPLVINSPDSVFGPIEHGAYVHVQVGDNGCGMDEITAKRVVEPFFTTKPEGKGTGLGMSMVYGFIKQSEGFLALQSKVGCGTIVHMLFRCDTSISDTENETMIT